MPLPVAPILVAGATAAIGYFFQENSAKNARLRHQADAEQEGKCRLRDAELTRAQEILNEVSSAMDVQYYYLRHGAMYVAVRKAQGDSTREKEDCETWDEYERTVLEWMTHKNRFNAQVRRYFGQENHRRFQDIQSAFKKCGSLIASTYYARKNSVVKDGKEDSDEFYAIVNPLEDQLIEFNEQMIIEIQNQNVGRLRTNKSIHFSHESS